MKLLIFNCGQDWHGVEPDMKIVDCLPSGLQKLRDGWEFADLEAGKDYTLVSLPFAQESEET